MSEEREEDRPGRAAGDESAGDDDLVIRESGWPGDEEDWPDELDDWPDGADGRPVGDDDRPEAGAGESPSGAAAGRAVPGAAVGSTTEARGPVAPGASRPAVPEESQAETTRRSGIAYAAGLTLFVTVVSFMGLGWLLDRWLGTRWLLVAGIVVGSVAGFTQFVRIITRIK